jgi:hypothetical protein
LFVEYCPNHPRGGGLPTITSSPKALWDNRPYGLWVGCEKWLKDRQAKGGKNPRPGLMGQPTEEDARHWLNLQLDQSFPKAESVVSDMKFVARYKDVTFETLNEDDFLKAVKVAFHFVDWDKAYEEFRAAGESENSVG